jgi:hypothetical protein
MIAHPENGGRLEEAQDLAGHADARVAGFSRLRRLVEWLRARRAHLFVLYVLIAAGSLLRVREVLLFSPMDDLSSDPGRHWEHARQPLTPGLWAFIDPPVFQMWVSLVQKWSLGIRPLVALYAGLLSVVTPWAWYRFLREYLYTRTFALAGWAALALLPSWTAIFSYFMTETLFLPLMGVSLCLTVRADRKRTVHSFCGMVALWVVTGLTRGIAVPLGGLASLGVWLGLPNKVRSASAALLMFLLMTVPFAIRNHHIMHLWSPLGTGWPSQVYAESGKQDIHLDLSGDGASWSYGFGSPSFYAKQLAPLSNWASGRNGVLKVTINLEKGAQDWQTAYHDNAVHGRERLRLRWENLIFVMLGPSWPDNAPGSQVAAAAMTMRWIWAPLFLLVVGAAIVRRRLVWRRPLVPTLIATWFVFQAVSLVAVNEGRYRKPLEGLLIVQVLVLLDTRRASFRPPLGHRPSQGPQDPSLPPAPGTDVDSVESSVESARDAT